MSLRCLLALFILLPLGAQAGPVLQPGEGLAVVSVEGGRVMGFGESAREHPMGSLAKLVWIRLEADEWLSRDLVFNCKGQLGEARCWLAKGHGRVDLAKATEVSCNLAFLGWATYSRQIWLDTYGEGAARARLEEAFRPFLGRRMAPGDGLPVLTPAWVGDGDLLRTSPEAMAQWLAAPDQEMLLRTMRRLLIPIWKADPASPGWWMKTGTAPVPSDPGATSAWVVGSDGTRIAVLHLPRGRGKAEGLARFRDILGLNTK